MGLLPTIGIGMQIKINDPPREFSVGCDQGIVLKDCAHIALCDDEQITFNTAQGAGYDVTRKSWGFYAAPSINGRLSRFGLRAVLVKNQSMQYYVLLVEQGKESDFEAYVRCESLTICGWLNERSLPHVEKALESSAV